MIKEKLLKLFKNKKTYHSLILYFFVLIILFVLLVFVSYRIMTPKVVNKDFKQICYDYCESVDMDYNSCLQENDTIEVSCKKDNSVCLIIDNETKCLTLTDYKNVSLRSISVLR